MSGRTAPGGAAGETRATDRAEARTGPTAPIEEVLARLGADLYAGTETLAAEVGLGHEELIRNLVARARQSPPAIATRKERRWGTFDWVVGVGCLLLVALAGRAIWLLRTPPAEPVVPPIELFLGGGPAPVEESDLAHRRLLALPIEPASYALLGELPARLSAAVVPGPSDAVAPRPVHRLDDLLVLRAETAGDGVAVLAAVPEAELPALLEALSGATVHLLRRPPASSGRSVEETKPVSSRLDPTQPDGGELIPSKAPEEPGRGRSSPP